MQVRAERAGEEGAIHEVVREAFVGAAHTDGTEQHIVDALRAASALTASLVAEVDGVVVGHVAASPVQIDGAWRGWYGIGPVAVAPAWQGRGVGGRLMWAVLEVLRAEGAAGCVLLGDPGYYARFGFVQAAPLVLPGVPAEYFQVCMLGASVCPAGEVRYHEAFVVGEG